MENVFQQHAISILKSMYLSGSSKEAAYMVFHIWREHLHTNANIHCFIHKMNWLISWFQTRSNTKALPGPCDENFGVYRVETKIIFITKFRTQSAAYSFQVPWPWPHVCLSSCFYATRPFSSFIPLCCWLWCLSDLSQVNSLSQMNPEKQHFLRDNELYQLSVSSDEYT